MSRWVVLYLAGFALLAFLALLNQANWKNSQLALAVLLIMGLAVGILLRQGKTGGRGKSGGRRRPGGRGRPGDRRR